jgi:hypothetical protein
MQRFVVNGHALNPEPRSGSTCLRFAEDHGTSWSRRVGVWSVFRPPVWRAFWPVKVGLAEPTRNVRRVAVLNRPTVGPMRGALALGREKPLLRYN